MALNAEPGSYTVCRAGEDAVAVVGTQDEGLLKNGLKAVLCGCIAQDVVLDVEDATQGVAEGVRLKVPLGQLML